MSIIEGAAEETVLALAADRWLAHQFLFTHRHTMPSAPAHRRATAILHGPEPRHVLKAFRGFGKSTLVEEAIVIEALFGEFRNKLIVGSSYDRACERLASIKREFEINQDIDWLFGNVKGSVWQEGKIVLASGICIQALGRDQSLRGTKHFDWRPDSWLIDDIEDRETAQTPGGRRKTMDWLLKEFLPALADPVASRGRVLGTPIDPKSLVVELEKRGWPTTSFPVEYLDADGARRATWPANFPLSKIDLIKLDYRRDIQSFRQEYMCEAVADSDRVFTREMLRVEPRERGWHAVYAMIDPARTVNRTSATTGWAVWSWIGSRLVVWAAGAEMLKPDEIIDLCFATASGWNPVWIGVEEDGLNEFILQPLRHEQARRGIAIPVKAVRAPRGKIDFIRGLQPFFAAREAIFAAPLPELEEQLLSFPTGRIDAANALAYALQMRPAAPIYDGFGDDNVADGLEPDPGRPFWLAANATGSLVTAVLCQLIDGRVLVYADWVREGSAAEMVPEIAAEAGLIGDARLVRERGSRDWREALKLPESALVYRRVKPKWVVPPHHGNLWNNVGLEQAVRRLPAGLARGTAPEVGRDRLRSLLAMTARGEAAVAADVQAPWTLRAFAGGYTRGPRKGGGVAEHAEEGVYRVLMEGLESFVGMSAGSADDEDDDNGQPFDVTSGGIRYRSAMPRRS